MNELSRNILADWVSVLEGCHFKYEIDIPEKECFIRIDANAYTRIINNLLQNIIVHSEGDEVMLRVLDDQS